MRMSACRVACDAATDCPCSSGAWSDRSADWADVLRRDSEGGGGVSSAGLERTGVDDGTFWMDLTHFLMAFSRLDVCVASPQAHAASFANAFPAKKAPWRVAKVVYEATADGDTDVAVMALQPTPRGTFCRGDRKKSYRPGDLQVVVVDAETVDSLLLERRFRGAAV